GSCRGGSHGRCPCQQSHGPRKGRLDHGPGREVRVMRCPPEISEILSAIVRAGLLRIRSLGWSGRADRCAIEADHIHNLPDLIEDFSQERLAYYWDIERPAYIAQVPEEQRNGWETLWEQLQPHVALRNGSTVPVEGASSGGSVSDPGRNCGLSTGMQD